MVSMMMRNLVMSSLAAPDAVERFEDRMFDLAASQDIDIQAEDVAGLEDLGERYVRETLRLLEDMGCDLIQGYILTRPLPFDGMIDWMSGQPRRSRISAS